MPCKNCSENSSLTYSRCNPPLSSNCTFYQGDSLECVNDTTFSICKGDSMTSVQIEMFNRICQLIGDTDASKVLIPICLQTAWNNSDLTVLNLFNLVLTNACDLQTQITNLGNNLTTINPTVTVRNITNCCNGCTVELSLSDALNNIITEICNLKASVTALQENLLVIEEDLSVVKSNYESFNTFMAKQTLLNISLQSNIVTIKSKTDCLDNCP